MELPRLLALSPGDLTEADVGPFLRRVGAAVEAGLAGLVLREARLDDRTWLALFRSLRAQAPELWLAGHDRVHVALRVPCQALHLGFRSLPPSEVRPFAAGRLLGLSTHATDDPGAWGEADYLFHGPVHATPSKEGWVEPTGTAGLARAVALAGRPVYGLGGVTPGTVADVLATGAYGAAVLSGIFGAPDPAGATRAYLEGIPRP